jgi:hypothetical protein
MQRVIQKHQNISTELRIILSEQNGFKFITQTQNEKKMKEKTSKHFPVTTNQSYDEFTSKHITVKTVATSGSLYADFVCDQIIEILATAQRRRNCACMFGKDTAKLLDLCKQEVVMDMFFGYNSVVTPLTFKDTLKVFTSPEKIRELGYQRKNSTSAIYDKVYEITTENPDMYFEFVKSQSCNKIHVCLDNNIFHIMFRSDNQKEHLSVEQVRFMMEQKKIKMRK